MANRITYLRILLVLSLLFLVKEQIAFFIVYGIAGLTDIIDGYIARKLHQESLLGAKLDSIADVLLSGIIFYYMIQYLDQIYQIFYILFIAVFICKLIIIVLNYIKFHQWFIRHTISNKLSGILLFFIPFTVFFQVLNSYLWILFVISFITIIDELLIFLFSRDMNINQKNAIIMLKERMK